MGRKIILFAVASVLLACLVVGVVGFRLAYAPVDCPCGQRCYCDEEKPCYCNGHCLCHNCRAR